MASVNEAIGLGRKSRFIVLERWMPKTLRGAGSYCVATLLAMTFF